MDHVANVNAVERLTCDPRLPVPLRKYAGRVVRFARERNPEDTLSNARNAAQVWSHVALEALSIPPTEELDKNLNLLKQSRTPIYGAEPIRVFRYLDHLREIGNQGVHPAIVGHTRRHWLPTQFDLEQAVSYLRWLLELMTERTGVNAVEASTPPFRFVELVKVEDEGGSSAPDPISEALTLAHGRRFGQGEAEEGWEARYVVEPRPRGLWGGRVWDARLEVDSPHGGTSIDACHLAVEAPAGVRVRFATDRQRVELDHGAATYVGASVWLESTQDLPGVGLVDLPAVPDGADDFRDWVARLVPLGHDDDALAEAVAHAYALGGLIGRITAPDDNVRTIEIDTAVFRTRIAHALTPDVRLTFDGRRLETAPSDPSQVVVQDEGGGVPGASSSPKVATLAEFVEGGPVESARPAWYAVRWDSQPLVAADGRVLVVEGGHIVEFVGGEREGSPVGWSDVRAVTLRLPDTEIFDPRPSTGETRAAMLAFQRLLSEGLTVRVRQGAPTIRGADLRMAASPTGGVLTCVGPVDQVLYGWEVARICVDLLQEVARIRRPTQRELTRSARCWLKLQPAARSDTPLTRVGRALLDGFESTGGGDPLTERQLRLALMGALATAETEPEDDLETFDEFTRAVSDETARAGHDTADLGGETVPSAGPVMLDLWRHAVGGTPTGREALVALQRRHPENLGRRLQGLQPELLRLCEAQGEEAVFHGPAHVLITGPTSSGKSTVADLFMAATVYGRGERDQAIYVAPTRALAQAKHQELQRLLTSGEEADEVDPVNSTALLAPSQVVLSTSDNTEHDVAIAHGNFRIACLVYEKANILFSRNLAAVDRLGCLIVDELHMIDELSRGPVIEMTIAKVLAAASQADTRDTEPLRVVAISTEASPPESPIHEWLTLRRRGNDPLDVPPITIHASMRPRPVEHVLVLPPLPDGPSYHEIVLPTFTTTGPRTLSQEEQDRLVREATAYQGERSTEDIDARTRAEENLDTFYGRVATFVGTWLARHPFGERLLLFAPGIRPMFDLGERVLGKWPRADPPRDLHRLDGFVRDDPDGSRLMRLARGGIFLHYGPLNPAARREIERQCGEPVGREQRSQVLLATETLAYGVNLALTDVVIAGTEFPASDRRGIQVSPTPLSSPEFHNMAGRCGRLGPQRGGTARVYVFVRDVGHKLPQHVYTRIIRRYYDQIPEPVSRLCAVEDHAARHTVQERDEFGEQGNAALDSMPIR